MDDVTARKGQSLDIQLIQKCLPHRYPFLLVDRIVDAVDDVSCVGIKNVSMNEPQFQGHFPGTPVMPGVLLVEGMAQTAGALCVNARARTSAEPPLVYFTTIDKVKFRKPVVPGDRVEYHVERTAQKRNIWWFKARAVVEGKCVCEAEFSAMLSEQAV